MYFVFRIPRKVYVFNLFWRSVFTTFTALKNLSTLTFENGTVEMNNTAGFRLGYKFCSGSIFFHQYQTLAGHGIQCFDVFNIDEALPPPLLLGFGSVPWDLSILPNKR